MSGSDTEILQRWSSTGNSDAFSELVKRYAPLVYSAALRVLRNQADAEDVAQQCFLELAQRPPAIHTTLAGWLHRLATHRALNHLRAEKRRALREQQFEGARRPAVGEAEWQTISADIDEAIAALKHAQREVITRRFLLGESHDEVAAALDIAPRTVRYRQQQGDEAIRNFLRKRGVAVPAVLATAISACFEATAAPVPESLVAHLGKLALSGIRPAPATLPQRCLAAPAARKGLLLGTGSTLVAASLFFSMVRSSTPRLPDEADGPVTAAVVETPEPALPVAPAPELVSARMPAPDETHPPISVLVIDPDGDPVPNAALRSPEGGGTTLARTDEAGAAAIDGTLDGVRRVELDASGKRPQHWGVLPALQHRPLTVVSVAFLAPTVAIRVYTEEGLPLSGVAVREEDTEILLGSTDESGRATLTDVGSIYDLVLEHPEYGHQDLDFGSHGNVNSDGIVVYMHRPATLSLTTIWNGNPVQGTMVECTNFGAQAEARESDENGVVHLGQLPSGRDYLFRAQLTREKGVPLIAHALVHLEANEEKHFTLTLHPAPSVLRGVTRWEDGTPVPGVAVRVDHTLTQATFESLSGDTGHFEVPLFADANTVTLGNAPEDARLQEYIHLNGSPRTPIIERDLVLVPPEETLDQQEFNGDFTLTLDFQDRAPTDELVVLDGNIYEGYALYRLPTPPGNQLRLSMGKPHRIYQLLVVDPTASFAGRWNGQGPATELPRTLVLDVPVGAMEGVVRDQRGTPVPHATITVGTPDWPHLEAQANKQGVYRLWPLPLRQDLTLDIEAPGCLLWSGHRSITEARTEINLSMKRLNTRINGWVVYADGSPVPRGTIHCEPATGDYATQFAVVNGRFEGNLSPGSWTLMAHDGIDRTRQMAITVPCGELTLAFDDAPETTDIAFTEWQRELDNMLKQLGLVCKMFANESEGTVFPLLSQTYGRFTPETTDVYPEYLSDSVMLERIAGIGEEQFCYLGYAIDNEAAGLAFLDAYESHGPNSLVESGGIEYTSSEGEQAAVSRLREHGEGAIRTHEGQSSMPVLWQVPDPERDTGGWVLFMDGHTEWREYPGDFPMTEAFIARLREIQAEGE